MNQAEWFDLEVLGTRLKQIRLYLNLTQKELSIELNCLQGSISNLENGKGGSISFLIKILQYYSKYVYIDSIFSQKFHLISNTEVESANKSKLQTIVTELLLQAENNYSEKHSIIDKEYKSAITRAIDLLSD